MKPFYFIVITLLFFSCSEKIVQLPETTNKDITEINDVSSVYMFYNEEKDSIEFNRKNMISSTNWLVAIDKRLTLKQTFPHLKYLQDKRHEDGMHKNDAAKNYFSCSNPELKNLAFIEFTDVEYHDDPIIDFITDFFAKSSTLTNPLYVNAINKDSLIIGSQFALKKTTLKNFAKTVDSISKASEIPDELFLSFKDELTFQEYIDYKTQLLEINSENVKVSNHEFIYN